MDDAYPGHGVISKKNEKLFQAWDKEDPADAWECERCRWIEKILIVSDLGEHDDTITKYRR